MQWHFPRSKMIVVAGTIAVAVTGLAIIPAGIAHADPAVTYLEVGADSTADIYNGVDTAVAGNLLGSFNATNPVSGAAHETITASKTGTRAPATPVPSQVCQFTRPNGANEGLTALRQSMGDTILPAIPGQAITVTQSGTTVTGALPGAKPDQGCIDIARTVNPPVPDPNGTLIWIPFALDAVTVATGPATGGSFDGVPGPVTAAATRITGASQFTIAQLHTLYGQCAPVTVTVSGASVTYDPKGAVNGHTPIDLYVPQAGAGTRDTWQDALSFTAQGSACVHDTIQPDGGAVPASYVGQSVEQNDGTAVAVDPNGIMPFSVASWITAATPNASDPGTSPFNPLVSPRLYGAQLQSVNHISPLTTGTPRRLNASFPVTREIYSTVAYDRVVNTGDGHFDADLAGLLVGAGSQLCQLTPLIVGYGFAQLDGITSPHHCGDIDTASLLAYPQP
jgi:hypothetical protein